jgi:Flp pilus assembly protein TadG
MLSGKSIARPIVRFLANFRRDQRGLAAVEFAMLLPLMLTLYLGGVEVSQAISVDRKVSLTARAVADLVAQGTNINNSEMTNILNAAKAVAAPYPDSNLKVTVSSIKIDANKKATVEWSDAFNATARAKNSTVTVPDGLSIANTWIVWAEVSYAYTPTVGYVITGTMNLTDQIYMRPRNQDFVTRSTT